MRETPLLESLLGTRASSKADHGFFGGDKGRLAAEEDITDNTESPNILFLAGVLLSAKDFGRGV